MTLLKQIANLAKQLKVVAGVITSVGIIAGATLWITKTSNSNQSEQTANFDRMFDSISVINQNVEYLSIENSGQDEKLQGIMDTLKSFEEEHKAQGDEIRTLTWVMQNQENFTQDQLREIMDEMLKKNVSLKPDLDYDFPDWWIPQPNTDLILSSSQLDSHE